MTRVAILDYGMGNLRSVGKALEHVGAEPFLTNDHDRVREAHAIVLPGVGAMPKAMERVRELALDQLLRERVEASVPVIGLCMGMQLLFESTTEMGGAEGIGLLVLGILDSSFLFAPLGNDLLVVAVTARHRDIPEMLYYAGMSTVGSVTS